MFKAIKGKKVEIVYFIGGGSVTGYERVKGVVTELSILGNKFFVTLDNKKMINSKYIISVEVI